MFDKRKDNPVATSVDPKPRPDTSREASPARPSSSVIGRSMAVEGTLTGQEDVHIEGRFSGEIKLMENGVVIGKQGDLQANIKAKTITIHGKAKGDIEAAEQVEISATGSMRGDILSPRVILHDGAKFKGSIDMEPEEPAAKSQAPAAKPKVVSKPADAPPTGAKSDARTRA